MRRQWPFVGRQAEMARVAAAMSAPAVRGVVLSGAAGVGKSHLAREIARRSEADRCSIRWVRANRASAAVPLGALAHLLPVELASPAPYNVVRWAAERLVASPDGRRSVLVVDDAQHLDPGSMAVVLHVMQSSSAFVLITVREDREAAEWLSPLWRDVLVDWLDIRPFDESEVGAVLESALGGPVEGTAVARLERMCRGNLLFLRELVESVLARGDLESAGGAWRLSGEPGMTNRLRRLVSERIGALAPDERRVLEVVAFGEPLKQAVVARLCGPDAVEQVEARGLVEVQPGGSPDEIRLAHPLYGEFVRDTCPTLRGRRLRRELADAVQADGSLDDRDVVRTALWRLESGTAVEPDGLLAACRLAWAVHDLARALELGRAAVAAGGGVPAALLLATVLNWAECYDEAESVLASVAGLPITDVQRMDFVHARVQNRAFGLGDLSAAAAVLREEDERITDPTVRRRFTSYRANHHFWSGDCTTALRISSRLRTEPPMSADVEATVLGDAALALSHAGRSAEAIAAVDRTRCDGDDWARQFPVVQLILDTARHYANLFAGWLDEAEASADELARRPGAGEWSMASAAAELMRAHVARLRGHLSEASRRSGAGAAAAEKGVLLRSACLGEHAHTQALLGNAAEAEAALAAADECWSSAVRPFQYWVDVARPWILAARGRVDEAVRVALRTAERAGDDGFRGFQVLSLHDVVRLGRAAAAAPSLAAIAPGTDGELTAFCARHAHAVLSCDGQELDRLSTGFERLGMLVHAAEAAAHAAQAHRRHGRSREGQQAANRSHQLSRRCHGVRTPALAFVRSPGLTPRERQVAHLAASGMAGPDIAELLVVSPRTVDNHLHHVFTKLGITSRTQLPDFLD
ncbi:LuxR C-terminal-related transcriptional regulator [Saccharothrix sp. S26]|uniref:helix-turn-helix transcriptional regulator n=1 Tax=Saccharothrix sp. S26 TaxID=2907215 RepID=UPI001F33F233|nr:LuxR family transcriptional regulator [Saccharothrix sp. S26]MCE7001169.1 LuxR C-terminal-related transcriptional regulator [Saccharothrix sp. S26]